MKRRKKTRFSWLLLLLLLAVGALLLRQGYTQFQKRMYPLSYSEIVNREALQNDLEPALVYSVIKAESNFDPDAKSRSGAVGLMQLMPKTFQWLQEDEDSRLGDEKLVQPDVNIAYGCKYLAMLMKQYNCRQTALCAYNAGPGRVDKWLSDSSVSPDGVNLDNIPYRETKNYVDAIDENYRQYCELYHL